MVRSFKAHCQQSGLSARSTYPDFRSMKRPQEYCYSPLDGMIVHRRVTPSIKFAGTHLFTWVERGTGRVKCLVQEHNTMFLARARTRTARSGDEGINHEATAPQLKIIEFGFCRISSILQIKEGVIHRGRRQNNTLRERCSIICSVLHF